jgi:hypothetical protein
MSHIPKFGDASKSPGRDAPSPSEMRIPALTSTSPNYGICDTASIKQKQKTSKIIFLFFLISSFFKFIYEISLLRHRYPFKNSDKICDCDF